MSQPVRVLSVKKKQVRYGSGYHLRSRDRASETRHLVQNEAGSFAFVKHLRAKGAIRTEGVGPIQPQQIL